MTVWLHRHQTGRALELPDSCLLNDGSITWSYLWGMNIPSCQLFWCEQQDTRNRDPPDYPVHLYGTPFFRGSSHSIFPIFSPEIWHKNGGRFLPSYQVRGLKSHHLVPKRAVFSGSGGVAEQRHAQLRAREPLAGNLAVAECHGGGVWWSERLGDDGGRLGLGPGWTLAKKVSSAKPGLYYPTSWGTLEFIGVKSPVP